MEKKLTLPLVVALLALVIGVAGYFSPAPVARGGAAACDALGAALAKAPNEKSKTAIQLAIGKNCPPIGANCAEEFGIDPSSGLRGVCYTNFDACAADPNSLACLEPSQTCLNSGQGTTCSIQASL